MVNGDKKATAGSFIVLEGTDGSGKGTQFKLLAESLRRDGYDIVEFDFPQYDKPSSYFVKQYLNGEYGTVEEVGPYTASLFYALDRYDVATKIRQAIAGGSIVICNRFTGSNMAHQGTKFANAEQRRGFFIWLDNLEFETLKIPRPDLNIVLRLPADIAQQHIDNKEPRTYTDKKRDIHEDDLSHLERTVEVYDDMCQLFPKDFAAIDCLRNGFVLSIEDVAKLVRQKVQPLLPPVPRRSRNGNPAKPPDHSQPSKPQPAMVRQALSQAASQDRAVQALPAAATRAASLPDVSLLAAAAIQSEVTTGGLEMSRPAVRYDQKDPAGNYRYITPGSLDQASAQAYHETMDAIFDRYAVILRRLTGYVREQSHAGAGNRSDSWRQRTRQEADLAARLVLPVAAATPLELLAAGKTVNSLSRRLLGHELAEVRQAGTDLLPDTKHTEGNETYAEDNSRNVSQLAGKLLPAQLTDGASEPAALASIWTRNELDIVADMLYEYSDRPLQQLRDQAESWSYDQKADVFLAYIGQRRNQRDIPGAAVRQITYGWDLFSDFNAYCELQPLFGSTSRQALTPRHGYDMPGLIEAAGLDELYEECFDMSLQLYSQLQGNGFAAEAQYATLCGHRLRWKGGYNGRQAIRLHEANSTNPASRQLISHMFAKIAEAHPLLASTIKAGDHADR